jgi:uncharacterized protein
VRYWDTSALVPIIVAEAQTEALRAALSEDAAIVTWAWTRVEFAGAIERRAGEGRLDRHGRRTALERLDLFASAWDEVTDVLAVRRHALRLLARHPLRAADAAQLGAALVAAPEDASLAFVCLDERLADAAEREGLTPIPAPL